MKRSPMRILILAALLACFALPVHAQEVPSALTHQGRLLDDDGEPLTGEVELTYTIYDAASGGTILWEDQITVTLSESGFYTVELGGADNPITAGALSDGKAWLGVSVDGDPELSPRLAFNSVPFALRAGEAAQSDVAIVANSVAPGSITPQALAGDFTLSAEHIAAAQGETLGGLSCANGQVAVYNGSAWDCGANVASLSAGAGIELGGNALAPQVGVNFGSAAGTAVEGNDPRLSDARTPTAGSNHYIRNQSSSTQNASLNIGGTAQIGGSATIEGTLHLPNLPVASGYTQQTHAAGNRIEYEHILVNNGGHYDPVTHFFTAPVDGVYEMCASTFRNDDSTGALNTEVEGNQIMPGAWLWARSQRGRQSAGCIMFPANAGERIGNYAVTRAAQCVSGYCHFSIKLVTAF